jgi:hypothetical protein
MFTHGDSGAQAEVRRVDDVALRHQDSTLDGVIELANVPRPTVIDERSQRRRIEAGDGFSIPLRVRCQEARRESGNVFAPLAERWQMNLDRVETEEQILPESAGHDFRVEVSVRR